MEVSLVEEVRGAQFGDKRLDRRLGKVIEELGANPNLSIPAATDAQACPETTCICVGDSEADIYELFSEPRTTAAGEVHLLVRACQSRSTTDQSSWLGKVRATACLYQCMVDVSARTAKISTETSKRQKSRDARVAEVEVRATTVTLVPPYRFDRKLPNVTINVVLVEEPNPPDGCDPIQWLLTTTLPIDDSEQVKRIVQSYCIHWQIEIFFRTIKSGCRVEERQFETLDRMLNCEVVFEPCEWKAVIMAVKRTEPPSTPPRLNEIIRMIASLGGYVNRKSTQPGPQTLWIGLQRVHDLSTAWNAFGPDS